MSLQKKLSFLSKQPQSHGGSLNQGKRKTMRPLDVKRPVHLVLRSGKARGTYSMLHPRNCKHVKSLILKSARRHQVRIHRFVNVGNHLHLVVKAPTKYHFQNFLRQLSGHIAQMITGALKGAAKGKFWDHLAYSRLVTWGRDFVGLQKYLMKNLAEALHLDIDAARDGVVIIPSQSHGPPFEEIWGAFNPRARH